MNKLLLILLFFILAIPTSAANIINITASEDAFTYPYLPDYNINTEYLDVHDETSYQSLIKFDLSDIPSSSYINSATMYLYSLGFLTPQETNIDAYQLNSSWSETNVTYNNQPGHMPIATSTRYENTWNNGWHTWDMKTITASWVNGSVQNHGVLMFGTNITFFIFPLSFYSKDYSDANYRPYISVNYSPAILIPNNTKTLDASVTKIFLNNSESITFSAQTDFPVNTWSWIIDGTAQSNNFNNISVNFSTGKYHYISVNASGLGVTTNTLTWGVNVYPAMATATIGALNETPADDIRTALENRDAPGLVMATVLPFTNLIGAFFYVIVWFTVFVMMWIKQKSMNIPMVIGIVFGGLIISFLPEQYQLVATALVVLGIFGIIYIFFRGRG